MKKNFLFALILLTAANAQALTSITTGKITGSPFCGGETILVNYVADAPANSGNIYTAQLSDALGNFTSPINIGILTVTGSGTIAATIPLGTGSGTKYRIRVVSSNPIVIGTMNNKNLKINPKPGGTNTTDITSCSATLNWNSMSNASSYKVRYKKTTGNYSSAISVGNVTNYAFSALNASTSYELDVRAVCSNGELSDWAKQKDVVTALVAIPNGAVVFPHITTADINWNDISCASGYRIRYKELGALNWSYTTSVSSDKTLTGLFPASDYQAQVCTITGSNDSSMYGALLQWEQEYRFGDAGTESAFEVFPNPSTDAFTVRWHGNSEHNVASINIENMYGLEVFRAVYSSSENINEEKIYPKNLAKGLYFINIQCGDQIHKTCLILE